MNDDHKKYYEKELRRERLKISAMAERFLSWKLPADFHPDAGVMFVKPDNEFNWPVGTNLLTHQQAVEMITHCLVHECFGIADCSSAQMVKCVCGDACSRCAKELEND